MALPWPYSEGVISEKRSSSPPTEQKVSIQGVNFGCFRGLIIEGVTSDPIAYTAFHAQKQSVLKIFCDQGGNIGRFHVRVVKGVTSEIGRFLSESVMNKL